MPQQVLQLKCPGCNNSLRVPAQWLDRPMRCKHCQLIIQGRRKGEAAPPAPATVAATVAPTPAAVQTVAQPVPPPTPLPPTPATNGTDAPILSPYARQQQRRGRRVVLTATLCVLGLGVIVGGLVVAANIYRNGGNLNLAGIGSTAKTTETDRGDDLKPTDSSELVGVTGDYPRRMLALAVSNYLYANPVSYGNPVERVKQDRSVHEIMKRLARVLHVPDSQVATVSDAGPPGHARPMLKSVIEQVISDYLQSARAQDRIILLFVGHATEVEDAVYLVPIEGELGTKETLIPLDWLYQQLGKCKARQKVLIMDVCRFDPARGHERPGAGPMSEKLDKALQSPPEGVQLWSSCVKDQQSYEYQDSLINGGLFLDSLYATIGIEQKWRVQLGIQRPTDPLPVEQLAKGVANKVDYESKEFLKVTQTPRLVGHESPNGAAYNPSEALPPKIDLKPPMPSDGGPPVGLASIKGILDETENKLPPLRFGDTGTHLKSETLPPFSQKLLAPYLDKDALHTDTPFRKAVLAAAEKLDAKGEAKDILDQLRGNSPEVKKAILEKQRGPARLQLELDEAKEFLDKVAEERGKESKRWQANYDYVYARVLARMAYIQEYNLMLGKIRKDELPALGPKNTGWRIAAREKPNTKEARDLAALAKKSLDRLVKDHAGTPWEILGKRERLTALGLEWQPTSFAE